MEELRVERRKRELFFFFFLFLFHRDGTVQLYKQSMGERERESVGMSMSIAFYWHCIIGPVPVITRLLEFLSFPLGGWYLDEDAYIYERNAGNSNV